MLCASSFELAWLRAHEGCSGISFLRFFDNLRFATFSFDKSWRLFDVATKQELLFQEGHSREVYEVAFHIDGAVRIGNSFD